VAAAPWGCEAMRLLRPGTAPRPPPPRKFRPEAPHHRARKQQRWRRRGHSSLLPIHSRPTPSVARLDRGGCAGHTRHSPTERRACRHAVGGDPVHVPGGVQPPSTGGIPPSQPGPPRKRCRGEAGGTEDADGASPPGRWPSPTVRHQAVALRPARGGSARWPPAQTVEAPSRGGGKAPMPLARPPLPAGTLTGRHPQPATGPHRARRGVGMGRERAPVEAPTAGAAVAPGVADWRAVDRRAVYGAMRMPALSSEAAAGGTMASRDGYRTVVRQGPVFVISTKILHSRYDSLENTTLEDSCSSHVQLATLSSSTRTSVRWS